MSHLTYCGDLVKKHDPDRFLISLFAPENAREDLWALFAFNHEVAKTREAVTEAQLGLVRLQWWREAITNIYAGGQIPEHEILKALGAAIKKHDLPQEHFETLIYAREFDLTDVLPANVEGFLNYADFTNAPLLKLAVQASGGDPEYEPCQPVAVNYAMAGLLRAVPFHATQRRCYMPEDLMKKNGVTMTQLYDFLKPGEGMKKVVEEISQYFVKNIRTGNKPLRVAQALAEIYLRQIRNNGYDLFSPHLAAPPAFKELRVWWTC